MGEIFDISYINSIELNLQIVNILKTFKNYIYIFLVFFFLAKIIIFQLYKYYEL